MNSDPIPPREPRPLLSWEETASVSSDVTTELNTLSAGLLLAAMRSLQERRVLGVRFAELLSALIPSCPRISYSSLRLQLMRLLRRAVNQQVVSRSANGTYTLTRPIHLTGNRWDHNRPIPDTRPAKDPHARILRNEPAIRREKYQSRQRSLITVRPSKRLEASSHRSNRKLRFKRISDRQQTQRRS